MPSERAGAPPPGLTAYRVVAGDSSVVIFTYPLEPDGMERLTGAERDAVQRALAGATNEEIAQARGTAVRTVANLMSRAFRKLGVSSRRELAARARLPLQPAGPRE